MRYLKSKFFLFTISHLAYYCYHFYLRISFPAYQHISYEESLQITAIILFALVIDIHLTIMRSNLQITAQLFVKSISLKVILKFCKCSESRGLIRLA